MAQEGKRKLEHFYSLLDSLKHSVVPNHANADIGPVKTLDLLQSIDQVKSIPDQQFIDVIVQGCKSINHVQDATLARSLCHFMYKQLTKQIRMSSFRPVQFDTCINFLMDGIGSAEEELVSDDSTPNTIDYHYIVDLLRTLSVLVFDNTHHTIRSIKRLSAILLKLASPEQTRSIEVRRMAINCIGNLCAVNTTAASTATAAHNSHNSNARLQPYFNEFYACLLSNICNVKRTDQGTLMTSASTVDGSSSITLDLNDANVRKVGSSTLRALSFLLLQDKSLVSNPFCDIIQIIHTFIFMHVNVQSYSVTTTGSTSIATPGSQTTPALTKRASRLAIGSNTRHTLYPSLWKPMQSSSRASTSLITSSESELSDATGNSELSPRRQRDLAKIRINALLCLSSIATAAPKALYPQWHKFLPDTFSIFLSNNSTISAATSHQDDDLAITLSPTLKSDNQPYSLFTILLYDPNLHVRMAVCNTLTAIFQNSKQYLSLAVDDSDHEQLKPTSSASFTSLSVKLGTMIHDIFQAFRYVLFTVDSSQQQLLSSIVQAISVFIDNCSFEKLSRQYLLWMYSAILMHWKQSSGMKMINQQQQQQQQFCQTAMLNAFNSIFSVYQNNLIDHIRKDFLLESDGIIVETMSQQQQFGSCQEQVWQLCNTLAKVYYKESLPALWELVRKAYLLPNAQRIEKASHQQQQSSISTAATCFLSPSSIKFMETYATAMSEFSEQLEKQVVWWQQVLTEYLAKACSTSFNDKTTAEEDTESNDKSNNTKKNKCREEQELRTAACDCFAALPEQVFEQLSVRYQRLAITLLFSLAADENKQVKAAAFRTLGIFVLFPSLREDPLFVSEMMKSLLSQREEKTVLVRVRASWAMANLCDALVIESEKEEFILREYMSITEWINTIDMVTNGALDNEKLKSNSVRSIGSLLRITPKEYFDNTRIMSLVKKAIQALAKNIEGGSSLKVRWNACHATSNMLLNKQFPIGYHSNTTTVYPWTITVYSSLMDALLNCKNFKVRINACLALTTPRLREQYGDQLSAIVSYLLKAWDLLAENEQESFNELKYKQQLEKQIKESLGRLTDWIPAEFKDQVNQIFTCK